MAFIHDYQQDWLFKSVKEVMASRGINVVSLDYHYDIHDLTYVVAIRVKSGDEMFTLKAKIYDQWFQEMKKGRHEYFQTFIENFVTAYDREMERLADIELFEAEPE